MSVAAAVVSPALLCLGYWLNQRIGLDASVGPIWAAAIVAGLLARAANYWAMMDSWRNLRRLTGP